MIEIIKVELFRIKKSALFWVMLALTVASPILSVLVTVSVVGMVDGGGSVISLLRETGLTSELIGDMPQLMSDPAMWALIATSIILSKEFADGTMRNVLLANKTRTQLYFAYLLTSFGVSVSFLVVYFLATLIVAAPIFGFGILTSTEALTYCLSAFALGIFASAFVASCMCMFMFATRKQWASILLPLLICTFVPSIILGIAQLVITTQMLKGVQVSFDALKWVPFAISLTDLFGTEGVDGVLYGMHALYTAVFTAVFVVSGYYAFKKADLK